MTGTSYKSSLRLGAFMGAMALVLFFFSGIGDAHHPEIEATTVCAPTVGRATVRVRVVSWITDDPSRRHNDDIEVTIAGATYHGAFTAENGYEFSFTHEVPADGAEIVIRAVARVDWGPNREIEGVGDATEIRITAPTACTEPGPATSTTTTTTRPGATSTSSSSTTSPSSTTATTAPATTIAPTTIGATSSTTAPATTAPATTLATTTVTVRGTTEERPTTTASGGAGTGVSTGSGSGSGSGGAGSGAGGAGSGVQVEGVTQTRGATSLARTGTDPVPFLLIASALVLVGAAIELRARRARPED